MAINLDKADLSRAIEKARAVRPLVRPHRSNVYFVRGSKGNFYTVRFFKLAGYKMAGCDCPAGNPGEHKMPMPCYHIAAAVEIHLAFAAARAEGKPVPFRFWKSADAPPVAIAGRRSEPAKIERINGIAI